MVDLEHEEIVTLSAAAKLLPTRPHVATLYRWASRGVNSVTLETIKVGAKIVTSREALHRFMRRCSGGSVVAPTPNRRRRIDRAKKELADMGVWA